MSRSDHAEEDQSQDGGRKAVDILDGDDPWIKGSKQRFLDKEDSRRSRIDWQ
jgi:hypothetical protein